MAHCPSSLGTLNNKIDKNNYEILDFGKLKIFSNEVLLFIWKDTSDNKDNKGIT